MNRSIGTADTVRSIQSCGQVNQIYRIFKEFQPLETLVSSVRNSSFKGMKPKVSPHETDFGTTVYNLKTFLNDNQFTVL